MAQSLPRLWTHLISSTVQELEISTAMKQTFFLAALLLLGGSPLSHVRAQQTPAEEFVSLSENFTIKLPARYDEQKPFVPLKIGNDNYTIHLYKWNTNAGLITVGYASCTRALEQPDQTNNLFIDFRKLVLSRIADKGRLVNERRISLEGHPGLELVAENSGVITAFRIFLIGNRLYMLTLVTEPRQRDATPSGDQIILSFRILPRSEVVAARDRILASINWPLTQEGSSAKPKTDLAAANLKGLVRQVLTESEYFYDGMLFDFRTSDEIKDYSERGDLTREVHFADETPISITSFSQLNGTLTAKKVIVDQSIDGRTIGLSPARIGKQITRDIKIKYEADGPSDIKTYEDSELIERSLLSYSQNKRETETWEYFRVLGTKTETRSKRSEILDGSGNPVESTESRYQNVRDRNSTSSTGYEQKVAEEKSAYSYEFDSRGNWTKRTTFALTSEKGKTLRKPKLVTYRAITYY